MGAGVLVLRGAGGGVAEPREDALDGGGDAPRILSYVQARGVEAEAGELRPEGTQRVGGDLGR